MSGSADRVTDYASAIRGALREAGNGGLSVQYPSGLTRRLDSNLRQNVLDGVRSLNNDILGQLGNEYGADGVELSAHALCAEDHLPYQGRQFSRKAFERLQASLPRPIGMWNCKHTIFPVVLGVSEPAHTPEELAAYARNSREAIEIDGRVKTRYEWTQEQRRTETAIRRQKDVANLAKASGDDVLRREAQSHINTLQDYYARISAGAGLTQQPERAAVAGFQRVKTAEELALSRLNRTTTVDGISISTTAHAIERLEERRLSVDDIIDALTKPLAVSKIKIDTQGRPSKQYIGERATAAVNPDNGNITSTWPTGSKRAAKLKEALKKQ